MAAFELSCKEMADFLLKPASALPPFAEQAVAQALLLFKINTCLTELPDDPTQNQLAKYAIYSLANQLAILKKYEEVNNNPFQSETIGSYSYSKLSATVMAKLPTGYSWWDLAIEHLSVCDDVDDNSGTFSFGGISAMESEGYFAQTSQPNTPKLLSPGDDRYGEVYKF